MSLFDDYRIIYVDSNKGSGNPSDFSFDLQLDPSVTYTHVCLLAANIPASYYSVQAKFQTFTLRENSVNTTITVPVGFYKKKTFATEISNQLTASSSQGWIYTVTFQDRTAKYQYDVSGNGGMQPEINVASSMFKHLGFRKNSTNVFVGDTLTSSNVIDISGEGVLLIRTDMPFVAYGNNILHEIFTAGFPPMSRIRFENKTIEAYSKKLAEGFNSSTFRFFLTSEPEESDTGEFVQLNGQPVFYTFLFYKKNQTNSIISDLASINILEA